jgi:hypothetical protein
LFKIWDENDLGKLDLEELTLPLIALGLISGKQSINKLLKSLHGHNHQAVAEASPSQHHHIPVKTNITIIDFVKIFKTNPFVDKTLESIKNHVLK